MCVYIYIYIYKNRTFIRESAAPALLAILNVDEKVLHSRRGVAGTLGVMAHTHTHTHTHTQVQVQRSQAWQQVVASEALSEKVRV